ncbi:autotransporter outer membrane beta-barrel domain-containing protein [Thalassospira alkalitolerans]|uniref:autotransporter outer membrane beta-barrel domain-containing protein n=1 Tax=Thalassospira alkalitolerans TaxID=1293890 RepID=UPI0030EB8D1F|tara:strand:- start:7455 stop:9374 length:1920 start_codon:yes stop_codon:yes gene_type:complete
MTTEISGCFYAVVKKAFIEKRRQSIFDYPSNNTRRTKNPATTKTILKRFALAGALMFVAHSSAHAYEITGEGGAGAGATPTVTITNEATKDVPANHLSFNRASDGSAAFAAGDTLEISLSGGATFGNTAISLEAVAGGSGIGDFDYTTAKPDPSGQSSVTFTLQEGGGGTTLNALQGLIVSGSATPEQVTTINLPQIAGVDINITFTLKDSGGTLKGTATLKLFDNTLTPVATAATEEQSQTAVKNVLSTHIRNITAQSVGLSGLMTGRGFGSGGGGLGGLFGQNAAIGNALAEATGVTLPVKVQLLEGNGSFAANLNSVLRWSGELAASEQNTGSMPPNQLADFDSPFNIWAKGRWQGASDDRGGTSGESDFGLFMTGADYRLNTSTLIGVLAQFDMYKQTSTGEASKGKGQGWMVGPYIVSRLDENLIWDGRVAWGQSKNKVNPQDLGWEKFDGERMQIETNMTGDLRYEEWEIYPQIGLNYFREEQKSYTNSGGTRIASQSVEFGSMTFGPEVARAWQQDNGMILRPFVSLKGTWDFKAPEITHTNGSNINTEKVRARAELGGDITFEGGGSIYAKYAYDGIGLSGYEAHSLELVGSTPVTFGFLPDGSNLSSTFGQTVSTSNSAKASLNLSVPLN